uniref:Sushi domain-containing protein n=1 Tax=Stegastes partitus TaxID=144197 RepID=A0A3B4Z591_9TELE
MFTITSLRSSAIINQLTSKQGSRLLLLCCGDLIPDKMWRLGFVLLLWLPGALHAQPCPAPGLHGGYVVPEQETYPHGSTLSYACDKGHKPAVEGWWATSTCRNGKWSHEPRCVDDKACLLPAIPNADHSDSSHSWYEEGSTLTVTCNEGYEPADATVRCVDAAWSSAPVCQSKSVDVFISGCDQSWRCSAQRKLSPGPAACPGRTAPEGPASDRASRGCTSPGRPGPCGRAPIVRNGVLMRSERNSLTYECQSYYKRVGPDTVVCYGDGMWSEVPTCIAAFCSVITDALPHLYPAGVKLLEEGSNEKMLCKPHPDWWTNHYSLVHCINGQVRYSKCKFSFLYGRKGDKIQPAE